MLRCFREGGGRGAVLGGGSVEIVGEERKKMCGENYEAVRCVVYVCVNSKDIILFTHI